MQPKPTQNSSPSPNVLKPYVNTQPSTSQPTPNLTLSTPSFNEHSFKLNPTKIETIYPTHREPSSTAPYSTQVAADKDKSISEHDLITSGTHIYTDGSGIEGNIGAAAVLYTSNRNPRLLRYHLGKDNEHTVYKAKAVGLTLAAQLLLMECDLDLPSIYSSTIKQPSNPVMSLCPSPATT
ncbi:hypothetical protein OG21DRAFT_1481317 [Imleria badia]|nr:hypothetical protein OG21DRAFT_1481317 [Imleria badia]